MKQRGVVSRHITSIVLVCVACGLGAYVWFVDRRAPSTLEQQARKKHLLGVLDPATAHKIELWQLDGYLVLEQREQSLDPSAPKLSQEPGYDIVAGTNVSEPSFADQVAVQALVRAVDEAKSLRDLADVSSEQLGQLGLTEPVSRIRLHFSDKAIEIAVGGKAPSPSGATYVHVSELAPGVADSTFEPAADGRVYVVADGELGPVVQSVASYFPKQLLAYSVMDLVRVQVQSPQATVRLERSERASGAGFRVVSAHQSARVSAVAFEHLLQALADVRASRFVDTAKAESLLRGASNVVQVTLWSKDGSISEVRIGGVCPSAAPSHDEPSSNEQAHNAAQKVEQNAATEAAFDDPQNLANALDAVSPDQPSSAEPLQQTAPPLVVAFRTKPVPIAACVPATVLQLIPTNQDTFIDRRVFDVGADSVEQITIIRDKRVLEMARMGSGWHVRKPIEEQLDGDDVDGYLRALVGLQGVLVQSGDDNDDNRADIADLSNQFPPDSPSNNPANLPLEVMKGLTVVTLQVVSSDSATTHSRVVYVRGPVQTPQGLRLVVRRADDNALLFVDTASESLFEPSLQFLRPLTLLDVNSQQIQGVLFTWLNVEGGGRQREQLRLQRRNADFELLQPKGFPVDAAQAADMFDTVSQLRAERWVADGDDGTFGFEKNSASLRLWWEDKEEKRERGILLGDRCAGAVQGRYAKWEDDPAVFVLPEAVVQVLGAYPIDRAAVMVDSSTVASIHVQVQQKRATIRVHGQDWSTEPGATLQLNPRALAKMRRAVEQLRAEGVVHLGPAAPNEGFDRPLVTLQIHAVKGFSQTPVFLSFGRGDVWRDTNVHYVRRGGIDATFAVAQGKVRALLQAVGASGHVTVSN